MIMYRKMLLESGSLNFFIFIKANMAAAPMRNRRNRRVEVPVPEAKAARARIGIIPKHTAENATSKKPVYRCTVWNPSFGASPRHDTIAHPKYPVNPTDFEQYYLSFRYGSLAFFAFRRFVVSHPRFIVYSP
jgi:hypothetical protein